MSGYPPSHPRATLAELAEAQYEQRPGPTKLRDAVGDPLRKKEGTRVELAPQATADNGYVWGS
jgi:hypothetical protein